MLNLKAGDLVEVRSKEEILATLDARGRLEKLPFMPEMFAYCGQRFRVYKRAHKTCDTVNKTGGRSMAGAVHLEGIRCNGQSHGGCQAECLIFWKDAWLNPISDVRHRATQDDLAKSGSAREKYCGSSPGANICREEDIEKATRKQTSVGESAEIFSCQATELPCATAPLAWWNLGQWVEDYTSGNNGLWRMSKAFMYAAYYNVAQSGIGVGRIMRAFYDGFQKLIGGVPYPRKTGRIPVNGKTPSGDLGLEPGDWVRVKSYDEILATLDGSNRNRGLYFDAEMVPYCGKVCQVRSRVKRIISEQTGRMMHFKSDSFILENVVCESRYSDRRYLCPRSIYSYWRDVWLERIEDGGLGK